MRNRSQIALLLLLALSPAARADWIGPYTVSNIQAADSGILFFKPSNLSAFPNPHNCANPLWIVFNPSSPLADRALAIGLTAQATEKKLKFLITGCLGNWIQATVIDIEPSG